MGTVGGVTKASSELDASVSGGDTIGGSMLSENMTAVLYGKFGCMVDI